MQHGGAFPGVRRRAAAERSASEDSASRASTLQVQPRPAEAAPAGSSPSLALVIGANLRRLRTKKGLSLERLSRVSGVSRAMLGQMELGRSTPTIKVLWKIARALGVPFSALITDPAEMQPMVLRSASANLLTSRNRAFASRALFRFDVPTVAELYELRLAPASVERAEAHARGTKETLVVVDGQLGMVVAGTRHHLAPGDAILFRADVAHEYWNEGPGTLRMYLVMSYGDPR